jgi:hypothetical protein
VTNIFLSKEKSKKSLNIKTVLAIMSRFDFDPYKKNV